MTDILGIDDVFFPQLKNEGLTASIYKRQWGRGMLKSQNSYFIGLDFLYELPNYL